MAQHSEFDGRQAKHFGQGSRSSFRGGGSRNFRGRGRGRKFMHAKP